MKSLPIGTCDLCGALDVPITVLSHDVFACMPCADSIEAGAEELAERYRTEADERAWEWEAER